jgi:virulence-associated protein VagC
LQGEVEISARGKMLLIGPVRKPREGWAATCREMARRGDDALIDDPSSLSS